MKTFADVKRRIKSGVKLLCVANTYRPVLDGTERTVVKVQTNAFNWTGDPKATDGKPSWTYWKKASDVTIIDENTFRMKLFDEHYVELRFM
jgi:hypothetical protein